MAQALFAAQPVTSVALGNVSFVEAFGRPLIKEDLLFSLAEDPEGRVWAGTLGGGLWQLEMQQGVPQETLHLTRRDGLASNLLFALAVGPDGAVWAATDEGVSRIHEQAGTRTLTTFGALDGLALPARDVAVDAQGTAWVATDGGLFRIAASSGTVTGVVQDPSGTPVAGADVRLLGTPLRAVTDAQGHFRLALVPPGTQLLQVDTTLATTGPLTPMVQEVVVRVGEAVRVPVVLAAAVAVDAAQGGQLTFPDVPGAVLEIPSDPRLPPETTVVVGLTLL